MRGVRRAAGNQAVSIVLSLLFAALVAGPSAGGEVAYPSVTPDYRLEFPRDEGSHPQFRTEWWYVTGWLESESREPLGFQVTFFRTRPGTQEDNPSRFAAKQVLFAHAALSDPGVGRLLHGERSARAGFGLAQAQEGVLDVAIDDWSLRAGARDSYRAIAIAEGFSFDLSLKSLHVPMLNGRAGVSHKSADPVHASYYYSQPQLQVNGTVTIGKRPMRVTGTAWLDHEWSTMFIDAATQGWDWLGMNGDDGSALMVSRMRTADAKQHWAFATWRSAAGETTTFAPDAIEWLPGRSWRSPRTGIDYPVEWTVKVGGRTLQLRPLMNDQESDSRGSTGTIYWEGATRVFDEHNRPLGRGYLELTGYGERLRL